jgi:glycosyltransferase involved in cell wall biosynthesis
MEQGQLKKINFITIYNAISRNLNTEKGLSGGDRIVIELTRRWKDQFKSFEIITCSSGKRIVTDYLSKQKNFKVTTINTPSSFYSNVLLLYLYKTVKGTLLILHRRFDQNTFLFTSSDFLPDVIPALFAKIKNKKVYWIAGFYLFAPYPFSSDSPYKGVKMRIRGFLYYYTQKIAYFLIQRFADYVVACNEVDRKVFIKDGFPKKNICTIYGGVDVSEADQVHEPSRKKYEAVFMARFHPQKAPLVAAQIWLEFIKNNPQAKLAMIGNGPQEKEVKDFIRNNNLSENIDLIGFKDGIEKYKILKSAKIFLHTSVYETGGMAAAEGMAAGLPVVAFDHEGFDYCYPKGMVRVSPIGDTKKMAKKIQELMMNEKLYKKTRQDALDLVRSEWDWDSRARALLQKITHEKN